MKTKNMNNSIKSKKLLALVLACVMVLSTIPFAVFAEEESNNSNTLAPVVLDFTDSKALKTWNANGKNNINVVYDNSAGRVRMDSLGPDSYVAFIIPESVQFDGADYPYMKVRYQVTDGNENTTSQLFWTTAKAGEEWFNPARECIWRPSVLGEWTEQIVQVISNHTDDGTGPSWNGQITSIRFDPFDYGESDYWSNESMWVDYIAFFATEADALEYNHTPANTVPGMLIDMTDRNMLEQIDGATNCELSYDIMSGTIESKVTGSEPYFDINLTAEQSFLAESYSFMKIGYQISSTNAMLLHWLTDKHELSNAISCRFTPPIANAWVDQVIQIDHESWKGSLSQLRIASAGDAANQTIDFRYIAFFATEAEADAYQFASPDEITPPVLDFTTPNALNYCNFPTSQNSIYVTYDNATGTVRMDALGGDPYVALNFPEEQWFDASLFPYMKIKYRFSAVNEINNAQIFWTNPTPEAHFFHPDRQFMWVPNMNNEWTELIVPVTANATEEGANAPWSGIINSIRFDMLDYLDYEQDTYQESIWVEYIAFFHTEDDASAYAHERTNPIPGALFDMTDEGMLNQIGNVNGCEVSYDIMSSTIESKVTGNDPYFVINPASEQMFQTEKYPYMKVGYKTSAADGTEVFWSTSNTDFNDAATCGWGHSAANEWTEQVIRIGSAYWTGSLSQLRIDPVERADNQTVNFRYIAFFATEEEAYAYRFVAPAEVEAPVIDFTDPKIFETWTIMETSNVDKSLELKWNDVYHCWNMSSTGGDPYMLLAVPGDYQIDLAKFPYVKIGYMTDGVLGDADYNPTSQFYWVTDKHTIWESEFNWNRAAEGYWVDQILHLDHPSWNGKLQYFRIDSVSSFDGLPNDMYIRYIAFFATEEEANAYTFDLGLNEPGLVMDFTESDCLDAYPNKGAFNAELKYDKTEGALMLDAVWGGETVGDPNFGFDLYEHQMLNASQYRFMKIRYRTAGTLDDDWTTMEVYQATQNNPLDSAEDGVEVERDSTGEWVEQIIELTQGIGDESKRLTLRIDPFAASWHGNNAMWIKYIAFFDSYAAADAWSFAEPVTVMDLSRADGSVVYPIKGMSGIQVSVDGYYTGCLRLVSDSNDPYIGLGLYPEDRFDSADFPWIKIMYKTTVTTDAAHPDSQFYWTNSSYGAPNELAEFHWDRTVDNEWVEQVVQITPQTDYPGSWHGTLTSLRIDPFNYDSYEEFQPDTMVIRYVAFFDSKEAAENWSYTAYEPVYGSITRVDLTYMVDENHHLAEYVEMAPGDTLQLYYHLAGYGFENHDTSVIWASSAPEVAMVDANGVITAVGVSENGLDTAVITVVTANGAKTNTCVIKVVGEHIEDTSSVTDVKLDMDKAELIEAQTLTLTATVLPETAVNKAVIWKSSDNSVAKVNQRGEVTAISNGNATITVTTVEGGYTASCEITVIGYVAEVDGTRYTDLQTAIDNANGETIMLQRPVEVTGTLTIEAGQEVSIDLVGNTITGRPTQAGTYSVIHNKGELTIVGNGAIICDYQHPGSTGYAVNTITNSGTLTINSSTIQNKTGDGSNQIGYAIDNNSTSSDAVVNIKGGRIKISGSHYYDGIRLFCNSETNENNVNINGGSISSVWMQNPSDEAEQDAKDVKGTITMTRGRVDNLYLEPSADFSASISGGHVGSIGYFATSEGRNLTEFITGGTFGMNVDTEELNFVHPNYLCVQSGDIYIVSASVVIVPPTVKDVDFGSTGSDDGDGESTLTDEQKQEIVNSIIDNTAVSGVEDNKMNSVSNRDFLVAALNNQFENGEFEVSVDELLEKAISIVKIDLVGVEINSNNGTEQNLADVPPEKVSFDVQPTVVVNNNGQVVDVDVSTFAEEVVFRLPIHKNEKRGYVRIYHVKVVDGEEVAEQVIGPYKDGCFKVIKERDAEDKLTGEQYVEVSAKDFSVYSVEPYIPTIELTDIYCSTTLGDKIGVNFYMTIPVEDAADTNARIRFKQFKADDTVVIEEKTVSAAERIEEFEVEEQEFVRYKFTHEVAAKEMGDNIYVEFESDAYRSIPIGPYRVANYVNDVLQSDNMTDDAKALAKVMIYYGGYAQDLFDYKTDNLAYTEIGLSAENSGVSTVTTEQLSHFSHDTSKSISGVTYVGSRLVLEGNTSFQPYFQISDAAMNSVEFIYNGKTLESNLDISNGFYYISLDDIAAKDLDEEQIVIIRNTVNGTTATMTFVPLTYAKDVCAKMNNNQELVNLVKALYLYNQKANAFFEANQ